jgi:hypothetical protein
LRLLSHRRFAYQSSPSGGQSASCRGLITARSFFVHRKITS